MTKNQVTTETTTETETVLTAEQLIAKYGNKSQAIRALNAAGKDRGTISKMLGIRYQHVRNVLITPLKRDGQL